MNILEQIYTKFHRLLKLMYIKVSNKVSHEAQMFLFSNRMIYAIILYTSTCGTMKQFRKRNEMLSDFAIIVNREYNLFTEDGKVQITSEYIRNKWQEKLKKQHVAKMNKFIADDLGIDLFTDPAKTGAQNG